jgi:hypothetical protein
VGVDAWRVGEFTMMCVVVDVVLLADCRGSPSQGPHTPNPNPVSLPCCFKHIDPTSFHAPRDNNRPFAMVCSAHSITSSGKKILELIQQEFKAA